MTRLFCKVLLSFLLVLLLAAVLLASGSVVLAEDDAEIWGGLYRKASTYGQKYEIMLDIVGLDKRELIPILEHALDELIQERRMLGVSEVEVRVKLLTIIVMELGDLNAIDARPLIYSVVRREEDSYLKGEALIALGKIGAQSNAGDIALILSNMNFYRGIDVSEDEAVAYGCIFALEKLRDPVGYIPILLATKAGYSRKIVEAAKGALDTLIDDPTGIVKQYISTEPSLELKLKVMQAFSSSKAPVENKIEVALEAIHQGFINKPKDINDRTNLREIRVKALEVFVEHEAEHTYALPLIEQILYLYTDINEKITALEALSNFTGEDAIQTLTRFLAYQNYKQKHGLSAPDNRLVITTIRALGKTGSEIAHEELLRVKFSGYPAVVEREAARVLKKFD